jgi:drug/metabolite transporter (DMT)-like permease
LDFGIRRAAGKFTALLAWFAFREALDRRIALGMVAIIAGAALLPWQGIFGSAAQRGRCW